MSKFSDLLAAFAPDAADFNVDDFRTALAAAYAEDISVRDARIEKANETLASTEEEVKTWKAKNWDLLQQIPADADRVKTPGAPTTPEEEAEANVSVNDLFGKKE